MGAGCSNANAVAVSDSVKNGQAPKNDAITLSKEAQEELKKLQAENPDGTFGGTPINSNKLKKLMGMNDRPNDDVEDQDVTKEPMHRIKHKELWEAVEINDAEKVGAYLNEYEERTGEELKQNELYDETGNTVIHKAASLGHAESLMLLLERTGARPDILNASLATPLHLACKNNRVDAAKFLIGCGVDANAQDEHGQVPLLICCIHGHFDLARMIVDAHMSGHLPEPLEVDIKDHRGLSPLNCAAIKGDFRMVMLLVLNAGAAVDGTSPKGCTPLLYAARGGYAEVVRFLLLKGASPLAQDNAGGTVLHHAIEKGHLSVLTTLHEHGFDVHTAIDIPDNAGRTPIFEALDNCDNLDLLQFITRSRAQGGFAAQVNLTNYNGQTPLFSAAREGNLEVVKHLVEECDAKVDLTQGELYKEEDETGDEQYDSLEEKFFMDAYKNCMTPLQVAVILGNEDIMMYLIEKGANPNLQTKIKGYSCLHLAVLANKPEIIIELLTRTHANPQLPDFGGRTLQDMIEIFIPSYLESFNKLLENLAHMKDTETAAQEESVLGLARKGEEEPVVATHYYNPDDERSLQGLGAGADKSKMLDLYAKADAHPNKENDATMGNEVKARKLAEVDESEVIVEHEHLVDPAVAAVYGQKIAKALIAVDWRFKEQALKYIFKLADKYLDPANEDEGARQQLEEITRACIAAVSLTCKEKVIKVFQVALQLLSLLVNSRRVEKGGAMETLKNCIVEKNIVLKLLQKSEEGNTRITNKIHETLLDLSYNPEVGEALTSSFILQRVQAHNRAIQQKLAQKKHSDQTDSAENLQQLSQSEKIETEQALGNYKGLLAQLALLFKFVNSFGIASQTRGPLSVKDVLKAVLPSVQHANADVRNAATKILLDVHKLSGCVNDDELVGAGLPEKTRNVINAKLAEVTVEKNLAASQARIKQSKLVQNVQQIREEESDGHMTDRAEVPETISANSPMKGEQKHNAFADLRQIIEEKSVRKDWQERELALKAMEEAFQDKPAAQAFDPKDLLAEQFLQACLYLLKTCLEENNMTLYLLAIEVAAGGFLKKTLHTDIVNGYLQSLITPVIMRTTDTNTRVRKRSVELINQIWDHKPYSFGVHAAAIAKDNKLKLSNPRDSIDGANEAERKTDLICQLIAQVLCDAQHGEKAIVGRLGLFIKRGSQIEGGKDLLNKPLQVVIGRTYEQLTEFACQWIGHKNTKIRQNAMRLIVEVCRINCMDPRGAPFKQRIVNYILGLRQSQRDPLVKKINEVCLKHIVANTSPGRANSLEAYIDVSELELTVATKSRAASMDHVGAKRRLQSASRQSGRMGNNNTKSNAMLPQIGTASSAMPAIANVGGGPAQPTTVLPHSEPLTDEQKQQNESLIEMMGLQIMTCFLSKNWATRFAAIQKVEEQLHNLDPSRRDHMSAEINRQNLPAQLTFPTFLLFVTEGIRDPVLKNFVQILELLQQALPIFFRFLKPDEIKTQLSAIISEVLRKTADMKQKIRESASNFCLYLSHQSPVGPEFMIHQVLKELNLVAAAQSNTEAENKSKQANTIATSYGNSHMIVACLNLLNEFQMQSKILNVKGDQELLKQFMTQVNTALKHSNPQVRKEAEKLFKTLYVEFGQELESHLVDQKPALQQKLIQQAKLEVIANDKNSGSALPTSQQPSKVVRSEAQEKLIEAAGVQRAQDQIRDTVFNLAQLTTVLDGVQEHLDALKLPNVKRRQKAIIELKKAISKKIVANQMSQEKAREVFEPLTMLMRHLLADNDSDVYIESLSLLKFVVGSLAAYLSSLDLHLMMGQFVGIIVQNTVSANMRVQVQTDKVVVFFAKHQNIGSLIVAKELTKSIERLNSSVFSASPAPEKQIEVLAEKREQLLRFYGILQLLLQQFSIILCYQQEFYTKTLECLADTLNLANLQPGNQRQQLQRDQQEDQAVALKSLCQQIVFNLHATDAKLLDQAVSKLTDLQRKTPLRKIIIEHESHQKQGKGYMDVGKQAQYSQINPAGQPSGAQTIDAMRDTRMSFASSTNRQSLFSPGSHATRGQSPGGFGASQYNGGGDLNSTWKSQFRLDASNAKFPSPSLEADSSQRRLPVARRMMSTGERSTLQVKEKRQSEDYLADHPVSALTQQSWRRQQDVLPALPGGGPSLNKTGVLLPHIGAGGKASYQFDAGSYQQSPDIPRRQMADPSAGMPPKFKMKSTGGAGFSSQSNSQNQQTSTAGGSFYEPSSGSRRTPRRTLANVLNNSNIQAQTGPSDISKIGGLGAAAPQMQKWPTQEETASAMRAAESALTGGKATAGAIKPPLYVPTRRQPSENRRSMERTSASTASGAAPATNGQGYKPKTGFSSMGIGAQPITSSSQIPYEKTEAGTGVGSGLGGATSKPLARPRDASRGASGSRIQSMFGAPEAATSTITGYVPSTRH